MQLEEVKAHLAANHTDRASAIVDQALARARGTLAESRAAIDDLRSAPVNLAESVRERANRFTQATGIPCELEVSAQEDGLSNQTVDHALSILSEALANITRHAQATQVNIRYTVHNGELALEVHDNGRGFDTDAPMSTGHYGLLGMRERARLTGGLLNIESNPQHGTTVRFVLRDSHIGVM